MQIVKSVGVLSFAKVLAFIHACIGLVFAPIFLLAGLVTSLSNQKSAMLGGAIGIVIAVLMPVFYGLMGFVTGAIGALLYNLIAGWVGGIELQLELSPPKPGLGPAPNIPAM